MSRSQSAGIVSTHMWRTLGTEGCERGELLRAANRWILGGTILRLVEASPAEVRYDIVCDAGWRTKSAEIFYCDGTSERTLRIEHEGTKWYANERLVTMPQDCIDVDLAWSPSTNTLPIRRLNLEVGASSGALTAAWVRFPELKVEPLQQTYQRISERAYKYTSRAGNFKADITVDGHDLVVNYEGVWQRVGAIP